MVKASTEVTYCINDKCKRKCWRHYSKYRYDQDKKYSYVEICEREAKDEQQ